jgi:3-hydroxyisobutyrate dehydrogenase
VNRVGFIGLGAMGGAIASRIIDAGWPTTLWARRPAALEPFRTPSVEVASTPAELAATADLVGVCVWADDDVCAVLEGPDGVLAGCRPGTVVAIHSTVSPATVVRIADRAAASTISVLDAPVSGGPSAASAGALALAVGGDAATLAECRPVFRSFASTIVSVGDVRAGQVAKLLNNALLAANLAMADDALTLGAELGLDPNELARFLREASGRSFGLDVALAARSSAAAREASLAPLSKDVASLLACAPPNGSATDLRAVAQAAIFRLTEPPAAWTHQEEHP